jgi:hypothetical protein
MICSEAHLRAMRFLHDHPLPANGFSTALLEQGFKVNSQTLL